MGTAGSDASPGDADLAGFLRPREEREPRPPPLAGSLGRRFAPAAGRCEFCGHESLDRHCKVVCPRCGAVRDCSDP